MILFSFVSKKFAVQKNESRGLATLLDYSSGLAPCCTHYRGPLLILHAPIASCTMLPSPDLFLAPISEHVLPKKPTWELAVLQATDGTPPQHVAFEGTGRKRDYKALRESSPKGAVLPFRHRVVLLWCDHPLASSFFLTTELQSSSSCLMFFMEVFFSFCFYRFYRHYLFSLFCFFVFNYLNLQTVGNPEKYLSLSLRKKLDIAWAKKQIEQRPV